MATFGGGAYYSQNIRWWPKINGTEFESGMDDGDRHIRAVPAAYMVWTRNAARRAKFFYYARQYGGFEQATCMPLGSVDPAAQSFEPGSAPYNVIRSATQTLVAKVVKNRPMPTYVSVGAGHRIDRRVRYLNRFVPGLFHQHKIHARRSIAVREAALQGQGMLLIERDADRVSVENLQPWEVNVDPVDARGGDPRTMFIIRDVDKGILTGRYPDFEEEIDGATCLNESFYPVNDVFAVSNRCTVIQAYHLPSFPGAKDGRRTVCLMDCTLEDKRYDRPEFPVPRLVKDPSMGGWWGMGLGDEISGFQDRIASMDERLEYAHRIVGGQIWFKAEGCQIYDTDFNDDIGVVISHTPGLVPSSVNPQPVHDQTYEYFRNLVPDAYGFGGISQMSANAQKPAGVTAALALQTLDDIETDRFVGFEMGDEEFCVDIGRHMLVQVREIADEYGEFRVMSAGRSSGEDIWWKRDVDLREDSYIVQAWATSLLPKTPAAKIQRVLELGANGYYDKSQVLKSIGQPDTTQEETLMLSAQEVADAQIAAMLSHPDPTSEEAFIPPGEHQDCSYALSRAQAYYNHVSADAIDKGTSRDPGTIARLGNLDKYMVLAKAISDKAQAEAMAMQAQANMQAQAQAGQPAGAPPAPGPPASPGPIGQPISPQAPVAPASPIAA